MKTQFSEQEWELLTPRAPSRISGVDLAPRIDIFDGKRVGLFWNVKANGDIFLIRVGELLRERFKDVKIVEFLPGKPDTTLGASPSEIKSVVEKCDVAILATAD